MSRVLFGILAIIIIGDFPIISAYAQCPGPGCPSSSSDGYDRHVRIVNESSFVIMSLSASNVGTDDWEEDILGRDILPPKGSIVIDFDDGTGFCRVDLHVVFENGDAVTRRNVNVCEISSYTFHD